MARDTQDSTILRQIFDHKNRADPYPLWAKLRQTPVCWQEGGFDPAGTYVVSTYREIAALLGRTSRWPVTAVRFRPKRHRSRHGKTIRQRATTVE